MRTAVRGVKRWDQDNVIDAKNSFPERIFFTRGPRGLGGDDISGSPFPAVHGFREIHVGKIQSGFPS